MFFEDDRGDLSDVDAKTECHVMSLFGRVPVEVKHVIRINEAIPLFVGEAVDGAEGELSNPVAGNRGKR